MKVAESEIEASLPAQPLAGISPHALIQAIPGLFAVLDPALFTVLAASNAFIDKLMTSREAVLGRPLPDVFTDSPVQALNLRASLERVKSELQADTMALQEYDFPAPQGEAANPRILSQVNAPVLGADGSLQFIIHRSEDVTESLRGREEGPGDPAERSQQGAEVLERSRELKRLSERLRLSEERLQAIFRDASMAIGVTDLEGRFTEANEAYCRMLGYPLEELLQLDFINITHPDDRPRNIELRDQITGGERSRFIYEKRYFTREGQVIWCRLSGSPLRDAQGRVTHLIALAEDITARKEAEQKLRQQEALARLGGKIARAGGWAVTYIPSRAVYWSREVFEILDCEGDKPPPLSELLALMEPGDGAHLRRGLERCLRQGRAFDLEVQMRSFTGRPLWLRVAGEAETDEQGRIARIVGAAQDITRQKTAQRERQQLSARLFTTLETMRDAFYLVDPEWRLSYLNSEAERMLGIHRQDIVGKRLWEAFPSLLGSELLRGLQAAMEGNQPFHLEYFSDVLQDWLECDAFPSSEGLAVYFHSISGEKRLRREIAESEQRLKYVAQAMLDVAWDWDRRSDGVWWSDGLRKVFGYEAADVNTSERWGELLHPDDHDIVLARIRNTLEGSASTSQLRYRMRRSDGRYAHVDERCFLIRNAEGEAIRVVGGITDVTDRVELEEQLRQAQRLHSLGQLTGGVAHDFNNLLTVILGNAELLIEEADPASGLRELADMISDAARRGAELTRHLLAFARRQALEPKVVDANRLVRGMEPLLRRTLGAHVVVELDTAAELWNALVDPNQLESALLNLCINARDAMAEGGVLTIETRNAMLDEEYARLHPDVTAGAYVELTVGDTGSGMPPAILDHVFEPFFTTKGKGKGTGLGLSTVFGFVKQSNGHLNIQSEPARGTRVKMYLPRAGGPPDILAERSERRAARGGAETVLLVEDDELVCKFAETQLLSLGYDVIHADSGEKALALLEAGTGIRVDLLFTDVIMQKMGGPELARRALKLRPGLKVLYTSGYTENALMRDGRLEEGVRLLRKPYQRAELAARVREALDTETAGEEGQ